MIDYVAKSNVCTASLNWKKVKVASSRQDLINRQYHVTEKEQQGCKWVKLAMACVLPNQITGYWILCHTWQIAQWLYSANDWNWAD